MFHKLEKKNIRMKHYLATNITIDVDKFRMNAKES